MGERIFVAGHNGMVGAAIVRQLQMEPTHDLILAGRDELDLTDQRAVRQFMRQQRPDIVIVAAARVGGIHANNTYPADFIYQNLMIECNLIEAAHREDVARLLFLGSSCIYPRMAEQPMQESALLTGSLEPTNEPYAVAKIAGIKLCESFNRQHGTDFRSVMPTNLYGPNDNYHPENSHVIPGLLRRFHEAVRDDQRVVSVWGSGRVRREFLHVDDMASACLHVLGLSPHDYASVTTPMQSHLNVGTGVDVSIAELAQAVAMVTGFEGRIEFDPSKPDGPPRKLVDTAAINALGWYPHYDLNTGLRHAYQWYLDNVDEARSV